MSTFKVEVVQIETIKNHPNADRLDILTLQGMGYQVISAKGNFKAGDLAFYFPIDSVIPEAYLDEFGIRSYYSKKLRAAKLRGIFSEGLLIPVGENFAGAVGDDYTEHFGVTKYEYPIPQSMGGNPENAIAHRKFPIPEHLKRYKDVLVEGEEVVISEKIHGTHFTVWIDEEGTPHIGSHNYFWKNDESNQNSVYIRAYKENEALHKLPANTQVFGEIYGVQDLKYGLNNGKTGLALFAVRQGTNFLNYPDFVAFCEEFNLPRVPVLYIGKYSWDAATQFNNTDSVLCPQCLMEGVIVQPVVDRTDPQIGRVVLKLLSDRYLLRKEGTELH